MTATIYCMGFILQAIPLCSAHWVHYKFCFCSILDAGIGTLTSASIFLKSITWRYPTVSSIQLFDFCGCVRRFGSDICADGAKQPLGGLVSSTSPNICHIGRSSIVFGGHRARILYWYVVTNTYWIFVSLYNKTIFNLSIQLRVYRYLSNKSEMMVDTG